MTKNTFIPDRSIAVLPLVNLSPDPDNEYFSDGMTEEIINALNKVNGLKVTARTSSFSFKNKELDVRDIGKQLGVRTVLEGSVRKAGNQLRITVQLAEAVDGYQLWSESFDRQLEDVFALQDEISLLIADKIRENFGHLDVQEQLVPKATDDVEAYELFLKGREQMLNWTGNGLLQATHYFEKAIERDPKFVRAYYELIWSLYVLAAWKADAREPLVQKADVFLERFAAIDTQSCEYHFSMATRNFWVEWNYQATLEHLQKAIELDPKNPAFIEGLVELLMATGQFDEALKRIDQCLEYDPLSPNHHFSKGNIYYLSGDLQTALSFYKKALNTNPNFQLTLNKVGFLHILLGNEEELKNILPKLEEPEAANHLFELVHGHDVPLNETLANGLIDKFTLAPWGLYLMLHGGKTEEASTILKTHLDQKLGPLVYFRFEPFLQPVMDAAWMQPYLPIDFELKTTEGKTENAQFEADGADNTLEQLMQDDEVFLDPELSLRSLAERMNMTPNRLSWVINEVMGKNFNEYVNGYRLETFKQKALDPANKNFTLLGLAYESGFNSKSVFNQFFKKATGVTPRAWVKARQLDN